MFGVLTPCRHRLGDELADRWRAHLCGLCLALRDGHGQAARLTTNTDAVMISILTEAQRSGGAATARAGRCPLRSLRTATVVTATDPGIRLAAGASLTLAAAKADDVRAEGRLGLAPHSPMRSATARVIGSRLHAAASNAPVLDAERILHILHRQSEIECTAASLGEITDPSGRACAEVFAATADASGMPDNRADLEAIGYDFGTIAHLLDAVDDYHADALSGAFNPLRATGTEVTAALTECRDRRNRITERYSRLRLDDDRLLRAVLLDGLRHAIARRMHARTRWPATRPPDFPDSWPYPPPFPPNRRFRDRLGPFLWTGCTGRACCTDHWNHCSDKLTSPCCTDDCGDCCDCCDCDCT
ncbi:DUF5685 family protein [Gordonia polyisoprenivorans]|uniref:DUF5685 family protein n=1 Tax=Gordonia polyisoprenivorans TaxID=84595 RepID=UPI001AD7DB1A|nr:DUF5685 family protein [Gordonia polyisoprenivorans]QTI68786.1 regulator [Gordonia polyisoprenivorans]